tara:strand:- start:218 stop:745 length:528 start_codon:yes stop_codon:yes gene_type:complete
MKKSIFNTLIKNPKKKIDNTSKDEVNQLKIKFPYCELIHNLSLIQASLDDDINFNEVLSLSSLYSINREKLFTTINPKILSSKSQTSLNKYNFEEWLHKPLTKKPKSKPKKQTLNRLETSITDNDYLTTETLAELYIDQGYYERAIQAYNILCLKYPKKSGLFANRIKDIKTKIN